MLLPELEVDLLALGLTTRLLDVASGHCRSAEVDSDVGAQRALETAHVGAVDNAVAHAAEQAVEVWAAKVGARLELGQRILVSADRVEDNVLCRVGVDLLREVRVDAQELVLIVAARTHRLRFERGEERLEPFE